jgi:hypothetical protein
MERMVPARRRQRTPRERGRRVFSPERPIAFEIFAVGVATVPRGLREVQREYRTSGRGG